VISNAEKECQTFIKAAFDRHSLPASQLAKTFDLPLETAEAIFSGRESGLKISQLEALRRVTNEMDFWMGILRAHAMEMNAIRRRFKIGDYEEAPEALTWNWNLNGSKAKSSV
jgi:hypothetical protein